MVMPLYNHILQEESFIRRLDADYQQNWLYLFFDKARWENQLLDLENRILDEYPTKGKKFQTLVEKYLEVLRSRVEEVNDYTQIFGCFVSGIIISIIFQKCFFLHLVGLICAVASCHFYKMKNRQYASKPVFPENFIDHFRIGLLEIPKSDRKGHWPDFNHTTHEAINQLLITLSEIKGIPGISEAKTLISAGKKLLGQDAFGILAYIFSDPERIIQWQTIIRWSFDLKPKKQLMNGCGKLPVEQDAYLLEIKEKQELGILDQGKIFNHICNCYKTEELTQSVIGIVYLLKSINGLENRKTELSKRGEKVTKNLETFTRILENQGFKIDESFLRNCFEEGSWMGFIRYLSELKK